MKDITHYFADARNSESATVPTKEVREERAKVEETITIEEKTVIEEPIPKRKRGRVKIKISRKSNEGTVCDIVESLTDLVDKTPSPYPQPKRRHLDSQVDNAPIRISLPVQESSTPVSRLTRKTRNSIEMETKNKMNEDQNLIQSADSVASAEEIKSVTDAEDTEEKTEEEPIKRKRGRPRKEHKEKLIELADKKGYSKRKALEEEEAEKMARLLEKRKKFFTVKPNSRVEEIQSDENSPKNNNSGYVNRPGSLLNYFSKATPEQLHKERLMKTTVTVKAEIHTPSNSPVCVNSTTDKKKKDSPKKIKSTAKQLESEFDEIQLIQTETIVLSPRNEKIKSPMLHNKPKWSLKIQLQSNNESTSGIRDEEEIYTPTALSKGQQENIKCSDKIPKILLPMKNRKSDLTNISIDDSNKDDERKSLINKNEEITDRERKKSTNEKEDKSIKKEGKSLTNVKDEKSNKKERKNSVHAIEKKSNKKEKNLRNNNEKCKTDKLETEINEKLSEISTAKECKTRDTNLEIVEIIEDACQVIEENPLKRKPVEKLAPLFTKRIKPSAEVVAARRLFLQSDISENSNNKTKKNVLPVGPILLPFPKISHVNQLQPSDISVSDHKLKFSLKTKENLNELFNLSLMRDISILDNSVQVSENLYECVKSDVDTVLSEIESYCTDAQSLWKSISAFSQLKHSKPAPKTRRRNSEKKNLKQSNNNHPLDDLIHSPWTDKYKPNSAVEIVGNEEAANKLKCWLDSWKIAKNNENYSSGEEFYNSDSSMSSSIDNIQVAVLVGPHGSGKTASVYAVAHELGYKVLEVNASSKRPGKKILKDFEEATKSHRVKKSTLKDSFLTEPKKTEDTKKISQNSLILFEDVDLIFDEDEGFVSATFQLASNTKRPIVMTLRETCSHLPKMAPQQFKINFQPVSGKRASALLQLISLAETGCKLSQSCIDTLCQSGDLRKGLLQLQYLLLSGKDRISSTSLAVNNSIWKEIKTTFYKPAIKAEKSKKKNQLTDDKNVISKALNNLVSSLDRFSIISTLIDIEDPTLQLIDIKSEPNISLLENMKPYSSLENTSLQIGSWLKDAVMKSATSDSKKINNQVDTSNYQLTKKEINRGVDIALSQIASNTLDRRALSVDYLPSIRTICRAEEIRNQLNSKRGNRFFHYLQSSRLASGAAKSGNILSAACKMLQEKSTNVDI